MFTLLHDRPVRGRRVGAVSNAGYECVAIADNLRSLEMATLTASTVSRLTVLRDNAHVGGIMDVHNPLDLTPMLDDAGYGAAVRYVLTDDHVDVGVIACVPVTPALNTLAADGAHAEDLTRYDALATRMRDYDVFLNWNGINVQAAAVSVATVRAVSRFSISRPIHGPIQGPVFQGARLSISGQRGKPNA